MADKISKTKEIETLVQTAVSGLSEGAHVEDGVLKQPRARRSALLLAATRLRKAAEMIDTTWPSKK